MRDAALTRVVVDAALRRRQPPGALIFLLNRGNIQAWNQEFESYTRIRYAWTLSSEWPRPPMAQSLISQMLYFDPVVYDWAHIQAPTLVSGGADDLMLGPAETFQERMNEPGQDRAQRPWRGGVAARAWPCPTPRVARKGAAAARAVPEEGRGVTSREGRILSAAGKRFPGRLIVEGRDTWTRNGLLDVNS